jgi:N-carbamoylputrescine amidase
MRVGFVEWPDGLLPDSVEWRRVAVEVAHARLQILVTNELPFGDWVAREPIFDRKAAQASVDLHDHGLQALSALSVPSIITSRPMWAEDRLCNEAIALEGGFVRSLHRKQYFPAEPGWYETSWFEPGEDDFPLVEVTGVAIGILLCVRLVERTAA